MRRPAPLLAVLVLSACAADAPAAPRPTTSATVAPPPTRDALGIVSPVPESDHYALYWADVPTSVFYQPNNHFNPGWPGVQLEVRKAAVGQFTATINGMSRAFHPNTREIVVTSTFGATTVQCASTFWFSGLTVDNLQLRVDCDDMRTGQRADAVYSTLVVGNGALPAPSAFTIAGLPTAASYTPDPANSYTTGTGPMLIERIGVGDWYVRLGTGSPQGSIYLVNAFEEAAVCTIGEWKNFGVRVRCFDRTGASLDARFKVLQISRGRAGRAFGFAWADQRVATAPYTPLNAFSTGGAVTATRTAVGDYLVAFPGLPIITVQPEAVQVTAFGLTYAACTIVSVANVPAPGRLVRVQCRNALGALADTRFNVVVLD